ncbi:leucine-rich repeat receptor-like serine threonine-protein kinase BAM1-like [Musa troglodytarum]|uniref:Leucine-rich repeat receptor-like serine threonine-protein kinase BAM1-like n=1 Tax=Musa troglodytarum TaxID=320322 RepID=A0A9E7FM52_9LILI|nr:leucine-rich repeat receptor-like serine threonine-protein kinase BAM1-like [Musa troglodytarum]
MLRAGHQKKEPIPSKWMISFARPDVGFLPGDQSRIPTVLGNLTSLKQLYLVYYNVFDDGIPTELSKLSNLVLLDLSSYGLDGEIPWQIGKLINHKMLFMHSTSCPGRYHHRSFVIELPNLDTLQLFMNNFTGAMPKRLGSGGRIRVLNLSSNKLTSAVPANLCPLN